MSQNSSAAAAAAHPIVVHTVKTDRQANQREHSQPCSHQLPAPSASSEASADHADAQTDSEEIFPAGCVAPGSKAAATLESDDPSHANSASAAEADTALEVTASVSHASDHTLAEGKEDSAHASQEPDSDASDHATVGQSKEAEITAEDLPESNQDDDVNPLSISDIIHHAAASAAEQASVAPMHDSETCRDPVPHQEDSSGHIQKELSLAMPADNSTAYARMGLQYPWMDPSTQQGLDGMESQPAVAQREQDTQPAHVTFATNVMASSRGLGDKIPFTYLAAAAADKLPPPSGEGEVRGWHAVRDQSAADFSPEDVQTAGGEQAQGMLPAKHFHAAHAPQPDRNTAEEPKSVQWVQHHNDYTHDTEAANAADMAVNDDSNNAERNDRSDAVSVASFANSAASGLGHLLRAQQPWSESSSSPGRTSTAGSADGREFSQLQAEVISQPDALQQSPQQLLPTVLESRSSWDVHHLPVTHQGPQQLPEVQSRLQGDFHSLPINGSLIQQPLSVHEYRQQDIPVHEKVGRPGRLFGEMDYGQPERVGPDNTEDVQPSEGGSMTAQDPMAVLADTIQPMTGKTQGKQL